MSQKNILIVAIAILTIAGCATPPKFQERRQITNANSVVLGSSELIQQTSHTTQHLNAEKTIVYTQQYGGGGMPLGLLLGPIGVAANVAMIDSATKTDAQKLFRKISADPVAAFRQSAAANHLDLSRSGATTVTPYLYVTKISESNINIAAALISEQSGQEPAKYMYQLQHTYTVSALETLTPTEQKELDSNINTAFERLTAFYLKDVGPSDDSEARIQFKSSFLTPRIEFALQGAVVQKDSDVTWIRTFGGIYGLQANSFTTENRN